MLIDHYSQQYLLKLFIDDDKINFENRKYIFFYSMYIY